MLTDGIVFAIWLLLGGATGALALAGVRRWSGGRPGPRDFERRFWAVTLVAAALFYVAFAALGGANASWWRTELIGVVAYGLLAVTSERLGRWALGLGWLVHLAWDVVVHASGPAHVPGFWLPACAGFDLVVGGVLWIQALQLRAGVSESRGVEPATDA